MAIILIFIVLIATVAFFYLKCSMMQSLAMLWSSVLALILTFSYYELVADLFVSRGYLLKWAHVGAFLAVYLIAIIVLQVVSDLLIRVKVDLGDSITMAVKIVCGLLTGIIFSGAALTMFGLLPMQGKLFYSRFDPETPVTVNRPNTPAFEKERADQHIIYPAGQP